QRARGAVDALAAVEYEAFAVRALVGVAQVDVGVVGDVVAERPGEPQREQQGEPERRALERRVLNALAHARAPVATRSRARARRPARCSRVWAPSQSGTRSGARPAVRQRASPRMSSASRARASPGAITTPPARRTSSAASSAPGSNASTGR